MPFTRFPTRLLPVLVTLSLASACQTPGNTPPPVPDILAATEPKPVPSEDIATSDQANNDG